MIAATITSPRSDGFALRRCDFVQCLPSATGIVACLMICLVALAVSNDSSAGVAYVDKTWGRGATISGCFMDGDVPLRTRVVAIASEWSMNANVTFDFGPTQNPRSCDPLHPSNIRISFKNPGDWSYVGNESVQIKPSEPTMSIDSRRAPGSLNSEDLFRGNVLHQFGHALGLLHEHQSPLAPCSDEYDMQALKNFVGAFGWSQNAFDANFAKLLSSPRLRVTPFDVRSVMMYSFPPSLFKSGAKSSCYTEIRAKLSPGDITIVQQLYGARTLPGQPVDAAQAVSFRQQLQRDHILHPRELTTAIAHGYRDGDPKVSALQDARAKLKLRVDKVLLAPSVAAQEGINAYKRGDFPLAKRALQGPGNSGDLDAQIALAHIYVEGLGAVPPETTIAGLWLRSAAARGDATAEYIFGLYSEIGFGVDRDIAKAIEMFEAAGAGGIADGNLRLGQLYLAGSPEVVRDPAKAAKYFEKAANQGMALGQLSLAAMMVEGVVTEGGSARTLELLSAAVAQDLPWANFYWALLSADGIVLPKDESSASKFLQKAASQNVPKAQLVLGYALENGILLAQDVRAAAISYEGGTAQGDPVAAYRLALLVESTRVDAMQFGAVGDLYQKAAMLGSPEAQHKLGNLYWKGIDVPQDYVMAQVWLIIAAARLTDAEKDRALAERDQLANSMTPVDRSIAQSRVRKLMQEASWGEGLHQDAAPITASGIGLRNFTPRESGTGFLISKGYLITNYHVVKDCDLIQTQFFGEEAIGLKLIRPGYKNYDLAVLKVIRVDETPAAKWRMGGLGLPLDIRAAGFPLPGTLDNTVVSLEQGSINADTGDNADPVKWRITARIHKGNSGGPIFDAYGNVVGIAIGGLNDPAGQDISFAYKAQLVELLYGELIPLDKSGIEGAVLQPQAIQALAKKLVLPIQCFSQTQ